MDPAALGFVMPPDWATHARTWMSWPPDGYVRDDAAHTLPAWAAVAQAIARFEPVTMLATQAHLREARHTCGPTVDVMACPLGDAWFRDNGPTFLLDRGGRLGALLWEFNAWGGRGDGAQLDREAGLLAARRAQAMVFRSALVNEGGAIATDGEGTVIITETVQRNPNRNPGWDGASIEAELRRSLGVERIIWLARGLSGDDGPVGTDGHVDTMAAFVAPGVLAVHRQADPCHPDHAVMAENLARLRCARDHRGRAFELIELTAPPPGRDGHVDHESYVNFAWANGAVVLCGFSAPRADDAVRTMFERLCPRRRVVQIDATAIFAHGGGIHCITQPQPAGHRRAAVSS